LFVNSSPKPTSGPQWERMKRHTPASILAKSHLSARIVSLRSALLHLPRMTVTV
jgi:hypothetical protein